MEEVPRRWVVKTDGRNHEVQAEARGIVLALYPGSQAHMMGTHETLNEALKRVGWL